MWSVRTKIALREKYFETQFCCLYINLATVKIWGQSDKFPLSFSSLKCLLQVKKIELIRENSAKTVNKWVIFTSEQDVKPPFLRRYLIFLNNFCIYIRYPISMITLTKTSKINVKKTAIWRNTVTLKNFINHLDEVGETTQEGGTTWGGKLSRLRR